MQLLLVCILLLYLGRIVLLQRCRLPLPFDLGGVVLCHLVRFLPRLLHLLLLALKILGLGLLQLLLQLLLLFIELVNVLLPALLLFLQLLKVLLELLKLGLGVHVLILTGSQLLLGIMFLLFDLIAEQTLVLPHRESVA